MNARTVTSIVAVAVVLATVMSGCAVSAQPSEVSESTGEAMIKQPGSSGGTVSGGGAVTYTCNSATTCCTAGSPGWATDVPTTDPQYTFKHDYYLFEASLQEFNCTAPVAVAQDGYGTWWFGSTCLYNSNTQPWLDVLVSVGAGPQIGAYEGWDNCLHKAPTGYVNMIWDPLCPSGCTLVAGTTKT